MKTKSRGPSFNFGANAKARKKPKKQGGGKQSQAWRAYVSGSGRTPAGFTIPD